MMPKLDPEKLEREVSTWGKGLRGTDVRLKIMTLDLVELEASLRHPSGDVESTAAHKTIKLCQTDSCYL